MIDLSAFPTDIFDLIIEQLVVTIGIQKAVLLRTVSRSFDNAILQAICVSQVIDIDDPATRSMAYSIDPTLRGKILAVKSRFADEASDRYLLVIAQVNRALDTLIGETDQISMKCRHESIASAVVHDRQDPPVDAKVQAQNLLCGAAIVGNLPVLKLLLEGGGSLSASIDLNRSTPDFQNSLTLAAARGHFAIVRHLLDCGARLDSVASQWYEHRKLIDQADWHRQDEEIRYHILRDAGPSALRAAVLGGHEDVVRLLLRPERRLPITSLEYLRAVVAGAKVGRVDLIEALFEVIGKNMTDFRGLGERMMWAATRGDQRDTVRMLLDNGVDVNAIPYRSYSHSGALQIAASLGNCRMARFLIERGAYVNFNGNTSFGYLPIEGAARCGQEEMVELLVDHGADPVHAFLSSAEGGQPRVMKSLLSKFPDLPSREGGEIGLRALFKTCVAGNLTAIAMLVEAGVSLNDFHEFLDDTPINFAKKGCEPWVIDHLTALGGQDTEVEAYRNGCGSHARGILVTKRTWEWVGKY